MYSNPIRKQKYIGKEEQTHTLPAERAQVEEFDGGLSS